MKTWKAVGIMSGTSMDGLDAVLVEATEKGETLATRVVAHAYEAYPKNLRAWLKEAIDGDSLIEAHYFGAVWSDLASAVTAKVLAKAGERAAAIDALGVHGQTVFHAPSPALRAGRKVPLTIQVGDVSRIAVQTGIPTVGNFRVADVAAGGQGAPMVPHAHKLLFGSAGGALCVQNMGGIGNVTVIRDGRVELAFDTGPGNLWMDTILGWYTDGKKTFDEGGKIARKGEFRLELYKKLLDHPYFLQKPPKSTGWEALGTHFLQRWKRPILAAGLEDALCTAAYATADTVLHAYEKFVFPKWQVGKIVVCGGGAKNPFLMDILRDRFGAVRVVTSDEEGVAADQVEAAAWALLAIQALRRRPNNEPKATGAKRPVVCGEISYAGR